MLIKVQQQHKQTSSFSSSHSVICNCRKNIPGVRGLMRLKQAGVHIKAPGPAFGNQFVLLAVVLGAFTRCRCGCFVARTQEAVSGSVQPERARVRCRHLWAARFDMEQGGDRPPPHCSSEHTFTTARVVRTVFPECLGKCFQRNSWKHV